MNRTEISEIIREIRHSTGVPPQSDMRFLVDAYYQIQKYRIGSGNQDRSDDPKNPAIEHIFAGTHDLEHDIQRLLDAYSDLTVVGRWAKGICGIGPVIAAGLMAHIDIEKAPTCGHIWRFAGLDPTQSWGKKEKRPWNARLKLICWKAGESFVKVCNNENDIYGKFYLARKEREIARNEAGEYAEIARSILAEKKFGKDTEAYKAYSTGKLPPAHIHARAKRYAVKLFLAHLWEIWYRDHFGCAPPLPYPIAHLGHAHIIPVPNSSLWNEERV